MTELETAIETIAEEIVKRVREKLKADSAVRNPGPRLLDVEAGATYLGRTEKAVRGMIAAGKLPVVRMDGKPQFDIRDLDKFIESCKHGDEY